MNTELHEQPYTSEAIIMDVPPEAQIDIYPNLTLLTRREGDVWQTRAVDPAALAQALARLPASSGLLPRDTLAAGLWHGTPFLVLYIPPRVVDLAVAAATGEQTYTIETPPLVWAGCGFDYRVWALGQADYPDRGDIPLWVAPFPNSYNNGAICWGSADNREPATAATMLKMFDLFLVGSRFNCHVANHKSVRHRSSVLATWAELSAEHPDHYPLDDLFPAELHLSVVVSGEIWGGVR